MRATPDTIPDILQDYKRIRARTERICAPLRAEDHVPQPVIDVSPPKWHMAHTTWFFETFILKKFLLGYKPFHHLYNYIFNSYYESIGDRVLRENRGFLSRPTVEEILDYRAYVDEQMEELVDCLLPEQEAEFMKFFTIGLQHEQQHQELLITDIKYILGHNPLRPEYEKGHLAVEVDTEYTIPEAVYLPVKGGLHTIGYIGESFAWDNEKPAHQVYINDFKIQNRLVTNAEYMKFMYDGGYHNFRYWLSEAWGLVEAEKWEAPMYWQRIDGEWLQYTLHGLQYIDPNAPVTHISFFEADAYASWAGKRLLTEAEWEIAVQQYKPKLSMQAFADAEIYQPQPLDVKADYATTCHQLMGDVWEWTYSGYFPYPGYKREEGALGEYNGKFMINQMVMRGGSCATPMDHIRPTYRNFFPADKKWQFTGIRLAE
jgi:ergothioneine biosynthesis protein EgtB